MSSLCFGGFAYSHGRFPDFYYLSFPRDKWTIKSLVYIVYLVDTAQTCLVTHDIFDAYAKHYGSFDVLNSVQLSPISVPLCSSIGEYLPVAFKHLLL